MQEAMDSVLTDDESEVRLFEEEFAAYVGCAGGVAVNSGTNALIIALKANPYWNGAYLPSYSCRALLDAFHAADVNELLIDNECDVASAQFGMRIIPGTLVVLPHMFGVENRRISQNVIHDITLSLGAVHAPSTAVCSFHRDKMISTGRGGMIVSQDTGFLERCRELAYYDTVSLLSEPDVAGSSPQETGHSRYPSGSESNGYRPAFSFGMTAMQAALGRSQLRQLPGFIDRRREIADRYTRAFSEVGIEAPSPDVDSVYFRYIIGVDDPASTVDDLARRGIEAGRGVNPPLHRLLGFPAEQFPGAEECFGKLLSVPVHPGLTDEQVNYIAGQVVETCAP